MRKVVVQVQDAMGCIVSKSVGISGMGALLAVITEYFGGGWGLFFFFFYL